MISVGSVQLDRCTYHRTILGHIPDEAVRFIICSSSAEASIKIQPIVPLISKVSRHVPDKIGVYAKTLSYAMLLIGSIGADVRH